MFKKKVLILGASSDIGVETVKLYLSKNFQVIAHYNTNNKKLLSIKSKNLKLIKFNLVNIFSFEQYVKKNKKLICDVDIFISLTGYIKTKEFLKTTSNDIIDHISANYLSNLVIIKLILEKMRKKSWGRILLGSSIGTKFGGGFVTVPYSISKHLNEFFPSTYKKYYKYNININVLKIGLTNTKLLKKDKHKNYKKRVDLIPIKRMATTNEVAEYIFFLCSEKNKLITNEVINISGGE